MRLDDALVERALAEDQHEAQGLIMAGRTLVDGQRADKPSVQVDPGQAIEIVPGPRYVSRGGFKLERAMGAFPLTLTGKVCLDVGSSTGGFTDCMLKNGARRVYAIDVGYGLLDWKLRNDERVVVRERVNARALTPDMFEERADFASIDVSFISLRRILPPLHACLAGRGEVVALVKPQFEAARDQVGKGGIVRDPAVHAQVLENALIYAAQAGFAAQGLVPSPITGAQGNIEFLLYLTSGGQAADVDIAQVLEMAAREHGDSM